MTCPLINLYLDGNQRSFLVIIVIVIVVIIVIIIISDHRILRRELGH